MKPAVAALATLLLGTLPGSAVLLPEDWITVPIGAAAAGANGNNQWFFFPDAQRNPRIVSKVANGTLNGVNRVTLTGGPPAWTTGAATNTAGLNKRGTFLPGTVADTGYLIGPHLSGTSYTLRMLTFAGGVTTPSDVDTLANNVGFSGVSSALDSQGNLHAAWIWKPGATEALCYGRRNAVGGGWDIKFIELTASIPGAKIGETAVVPTNLDNAYVYFTLTSSGALMSAKTGLNQGVHYFAFPTPLATGVKAPLTGVKVGNGEHVFYFEGNVLKRWASIAGVGSSSTVEGNVANAEPRGIYTALPPGQNQKHRVVWYDGNAKKFHYSLPGADGLTYTNFTPVTVAGSGDAVDADIYGFHFDAAGLPYILFRRQKNEGFVAFPNDEFDVDNNGRAEIVDEALNSPKAQIEVLPLTPAVAGVPNSADRFKFRFPTVVSANPVGPKLESTTKKLRYEVEVSPDGFTWTKLTAIGSVTFTKTAETASERTYVGVLPEAAPGVLRKRFARLIVTRIDYPY